MRIALISTFFHPVTGGVETHVLNLARELTKLGHEVEIVSSDSNKNGPRIKEKHSLVSGIKVTRCRVWLSLSYYHKFYPGLLWFLLRHNFDVYHVHGFRKPETYMALFVALLKNKKVVLTTHNPFPTNSRPKSTSMFVRVHDITLGKWFTRFISRIIIIVKSEKPILVKQFGVDPAKIDTIPNAIEDEYFTPGTPQQFYNDWNIDPAKWEGIVVGVGRINKAKGFQNLLLAVKKMKKVLFFIAGGDDGYLTRLKIDFHGLPNIMFTERFLHREKLRDIYSAATVLVLPSLHEAFGIVLLEAMAQGVPVIATAVGGPQEIITEKTGFLLSPLDQEAWREKIEQIVYNPQQRASMSAEASELAQKYRWPLIAKKIVKAYQEVIT